MLSASLLRSSFTGTRKNSDLVIPGKVERCNDIRLSNSIDLIAFATNHYMDGFRILSCRHEAAPFRDIEWYCDYSLIKTCEVIQEHDEKLL